jgi:hypothetical protein
MVKHAALCICYLVLGACATPFTRADIVRVAKDEVVRHGHSIPDSWVVVVVPGNVDLEFQPSYPVYVVRFQRNRSERSTVFQVVVNLASHKAEDFTDMRTVIPLH